MADSLNYVVASYVLTWVAIGAMLWRVEGAVRRARAEFEMQVRGGHNA